MLNPGPRAGPLLTSGRTWSTRLAARASLRAQVNIMAKHLPEMKKLMDKRLSLGLNGNRNVEGVLRGYDQFMNIVIAESVEILPDGEKRPLGRTMVRGNSILTMEVQPT